VGTEPRQSTVTVQLIRLICILGYAHQFEVKTNDILCDHERTEL